jgi:uncharacterized protein (TIGR02118 family)
MAQLIGLFNHPADPGAFDDQYHHHYLPLIKKIPGLRSYTISSGPVSAAEGASPYHLVAVLTFDTLADLEAGLQSSEGRAAAAERAKFAQAGVTILTYETREVLNRAKDV